MKGNSVHIALAATEFKDRDIDFNLQQMIGQMRLAQAQDCDLVVFGEAFLQGFDGFTWNYAKDQHMALDHSAEAFQSLTRASKELGIDVGFGYLEKSQATLYSSFALIESGVITQNYRRITRGWKEYSRTDDHYQEGDRVQRFDYRGIPTVIAICGDLWDRPEDFRQGQSLTL